MTQTEEQQYPKVYAPPLATMTDATPTTAATVVAVATKPPPTIPPYGDNSIEISNLTFAYRSDANGSIMSSGKPDNLVLKDMNLTLQTGSRCLLIGANGSGKSVRHQLADLFLLLDPQVLTPFSFSSHAPPLSLSHVASRRCCAFWRDAT